MHAHTRARECRLTTFILLVGFLLKFLLSKNLLKDSGVVWNLPYVIKEVCGLYSSYRTSREYNTFPWDIVNIVLCQAKVRTTVNDVSLQKQTLAQVRQEIINVHSARLCYSVLSQVACIPAASVTMSVSADCTEHVNDRFRIIKLSSRYHWEVLLCRLQILYTEINDGVKS